VNSKTGWVAGDSVMLKTTDGGATWEKIKSPRYLHYIDIDFVDEAIGYAAGGTGVCSRLTDECTYGTDVYKTTDGGESWKRVYSDNTSVTVFQLKAINRYTVFVLNNADSVRRTIDGGKTWQLTYVNRNKAQQIAVSPDGVIWLAGEKSLLRSADRGVTWATPNDLPSNFADQNWHAIDFSDEGYGVIASDGSHLGVTLDGGRTWTDLSSPRIHFGLVFHVAIRGENVLLSASADSNSDTIYWFPLRDSRVLEPYKHAKALTSAER
jgi:photosystem II stability/assembly factor-like uncharacterized protein